MWGYSTRSTKNYQVIAQELLNNNDLYGYSTRSTKRRPYKACSARSTII